MDSARGTTRSPAKRRSSRVHQAVSLTASGNDVQGKPFIEHTGTLEVSFHGCRYFSKHAVAKDAWLTLNIPNQLVSGGPHRFRARVAWVSKSRKMQNLFQVGVEIEQPGNIWGLANPPDDWRLEKPAPKESEASIFEREMKERVASVRMQTYYQLLQAAPDSPQSQLKRTYYELMRKFHPDHHMEHAEWMQPLNEIMNAVTIAYKTLTDEAARKKYDQQLAASGTFALRRRQSGMQSAAEECVERAQESFRMRNYGGAIQALRKALEIEPQSAKYHALLARSLAAVPQYRRDAIVHFEKAIEGDPLNTAVRLQFAELYEKIELPWRARTEYERILEMDGSNAQAVRRLQQLNASLPKKETAKRSLLKRILKLSPK